MGYYTNEGYFSFNIAFTPFIPRNESAEMRIITPYMRGETGAILNQAARVGCVTIANWVKKGNRNAITNTGLNKSEICLWRD